MKIRSIILGAAAGGCAAGMVLPASATVSDEAFNALSDMVSKQGQALDDLKKTHDQDQQLIQQLQQQLGQTSQLATNAEQKAEAAGQTQTVYQAPNPATTTTHNFMVVGDAEVQFGKATSQNPTFVLADFAPIFLFRANDNILFEAGFDIMLNNNANADGTRAPGSSTSVNLSFAQMDYCLNDYVTLAAGDVLLPLGTYSQRGAGWLNKIPDDPLIRDWLPGSGIGAMLQGATPIGQEGQSLTYAIYGVNGPSSGNATNGIANAGDLDLGGNVGSSPNWHANPSAGGRVAWFYPWKVHYDLELGVSGQTGEWSDNRNHRWSACVLDAALHLGPYFEAKGEYINTWFGTDDLGDVDPHGVWVQASYKLAGLQREFPLINNLEMVARYDNEDDAQGTRTDRYTVGYIYYISNTMLFEGDYEFLKSRGPNALPPQMWVLQLSYGF
jgi:hypothetical protein